jgi:hypothetical protein
MISGRDSGKGLKSDPGRDPGDEIPRFLKTDREREGITLETLICRRFSTAFHGIAQVEIGDCGKLSPGEAERDTESALGDSLSAR